MDLDPIKDFIYDDEDDYDYDYDYDADYEDNASGKQLSRNPTWSQNCSNVFHSTKKTEV